VYRDFEREFDKNGFVVFRDILNTDKLELLKRKSEAHFIYLDDKKSAMQAEDARLLERGETPIVDKNNSTRLDLDIYKIIADSTLPDALELLMGGKFVWHYPPQLRRIDPSNIKTALPYHQDYYYNDKYENIMVVFTPLCGCGIAAPSIELVERKITDRINHVTSDEIWEFGVCQDELKKIQEDSSSRCLELNIGDVVVFDGLTLHRTFVDENMHSLRYSVDARAVRIDFLNDDLLKNRKYITPSGDFAKK
jgi:hypothetical protein